VYGVHDSFAIEFPKWKPLGFVLADFSVQFGDDVTQVIYMAGARVTLAGKSDRLHPHKVLLEALLGTVRTNDAALINGTATRLTDNDWAFGLGAGYEWVKRIKGKDVGFRVIYDHIKRSGDRDDWFGRTSAGVSYRWGSSRQ
jgi:hypothetical protein